MSKSYVLEVRDKFGAELREARTWSAPPRPPTCTRWPRSPPSCALENPGVDMLETGTICRGPREAAGSPSARSVDLQAVPARQYHLWDNEMVQHEPGKGYGVDSADFPPRLLPAVERHLAAGLLRARSRVRYCHSVVGFYDNQVMPMVRLWQQWESEYKDLPAEQQKEVIESSSMPTTPSMPPRERTAMQRSADFAVGRGPLTSVRATVYSVTPYITTGALQAAAAEKLLGNDFARPGSRRPARRSVTATCWDSSSSAGSPAERRLVKSLRPEPMAIIDMFDRGWDCNPEGLPTSPETAPTVSRRSVGSPAGSPTLCSIRSFRRRPRERCWRATTRRLDVRTRALAGRSRLGAGEPAQRHRGEHRHCSTDSTAKCCSSRRFRSHVAGLGRHFPSQALDLHRVRGRPDHLPRHMD